MGLPMRTPKDFKALSESIMREVHIQVSDSTLKRIWGYIPTSSIPRKSTLDILACFLGYDDFETFCQVHTGDGDIYIPDIEHVSPPSDSPQPASQPIREEGMSSHPSSSSGKHQWPWLVGALAAVSVCLGGLIFHAFNKEGQSPYIIRKGQTFASEQDYLELFGIHAEDYLWGQRLPHHPNISVWGPKYHHPSWHNDGDSAQLLPTINEWWEPSDGSADSAFIATRNSDRYLTYLRMNELRITFMRGLTSDGDSLTFLGVYRLDLDHSDTHHLTWQRVAEDIDLNRLDYLEELRN